MRNINIDRDWQFRRDRRNPEASEVHTVTVDLPHDYMIENEVTGDAPSGPSSGYYNAGPAVYDKYIDIPAEWKGEVIYLAFDGVMMNSTVSVNGDIAGKQHYGYTPFETDITDKVWFGRTNHIRVDVNPSMQPNSRWYSGAGISRSVELVHVPKVHIAPKGIYGYTKYIEYDADGKSETAYLETEIEVLNHTMENRIARVEVYLTKEGNDAVLVSRSMKIQVNRASGETAHIALNLDAPELWDAEHPTLYRLHARVTDLGEFRTHLAESAEQTVDETSVLFGVRTVTADVRHGLRINGKTVKLRGGCIHHDNGMLGAVSLYDSEYRKLENLKKIGFNAIRTTHSTPSSVLMEAAERLGMYVFDECFDAWGLMKMPGDYSMFFESDWEKDLTQFVKRDRVNPAAVIWSTGNEITERGGLNNGYTLATKLAMKIRSLDGSRPVSNAIPSFFCGLDDELQAENDRKLTQITGADGSSQNADAGRDDFSWEENTEPFTNGLDIVGYNYLEDRYVRDHELYPDRVMLGSENYPKEIGFHWPMVESLPYVIGEFTWTACDYLGEAGIGKTVHVTEGDPALRPGGASQLSWGSRFPWRLANDADLDINGGRRLQGDYRSVVFGSAATCLYTCDPDWYETTEITSPWGFTEGLKEWNYEGKEGRKLRAVVFSRAEEVELKLNGRTIGREKCGEHEIPGYPNSFVFELAGYEPGTLTAVSYDGGSEVSEDSLNSAGAPAGIKLTAERNSVPADGHSVIYVRAEVVDENGRRVPSAEIPMTAELSAEPSGTACMAESVAEGDSASGAASARIAAFGSAAPITAENYTKGHFTSYKGACMAVVRSGYVPGTVRLTVRAEGLQDASAEIVIR